MLRLQFSKLERVLCLGCHPDDIEIGCGGALLRLFEENPAVEVLWAVLSGDEIRAQEARVSADRWLAALSAKEVVQASFPDRFFPAQAEQVKRYIHGIAERFSPDVIFTHRRDDAHQDHRLVAEITWSAFRNDLILEYEIPKYDGDLGNPNIFVELDKSGAQRKVSALMECFESQRTKPWFSEDVFWALMRLRGLECNSPTNYAEGFYCRKLVI